MQLIAEDLVVDRGARRVIDRLSLTVSNGEAVLLLGANGAGKTTLLRTLAGFIRPTAGTIRLAGGDDEKTLQEQAHIVSHANAVKASLTVAENVAFWVRFLGSDERRMESALEHFGLDRLAAFPAAYLSAGQKRRLGLARLLAVSRPLWLLDEPTASLDAQSSDRVVAAIDAHTLGGGLAVIATHLPLPLQRSRTVELTPQRIAA